MINYPNPYQKNNKNLTSIDNLLKIDIFLIFINIHIV